MVREIRRHKILFEFEPICEFSLPLLNFRATHQPMSAMDKMILAACARVQHTLISKLIKIIHVNEKLHNKD